eukprot:2831528-Alexandrium_andersonii.AAC.1
MRCIADCVRVWCSPAMRERCVRGHKGERADSRLGRVRGPPRPDDGGGHVDGHAHERPSGRGRCGRHDALPGGHAELEGRGQPHPALPRRRRIGHN